MLKIIFAGTPEISKMVLDNLLQHYRICGVFTQPDRASGRGKQLKQSPVKQLAFSHGIEVFQPDKLKNNPEILQKLQDIAPDIMVVIAYGVILPKEILSIPRLGCVNIHVSLLPKLRGAAPIQRAIMNGEVETGVSIMQMDEGMDTGSILLQERLAIDDNDTSGTLHHKLGVIGSKLILEYLENYPKIIPQPQLSCGVSYAKKIDKKEAVINWEQDAKTIWLKIRGLNPAPGAFTYLGGKILKIWSARLSTEGATLLAGCVMSVENGVIRVACGDGTVLDILELQLEGRARQKAKEFILGQANLIDVRFNSNSIEVTK